ncbi:MAG: alpha-galactosidase [Bacteroidales bacterium]|nr:alpha-galactosidase [Bacteroidales bacterium]
MRLKKIKFLAIALFLVGTIKAATIFTLPIEKNELWWLGVINHAIMQPLSEGYQANLYANCYGNQAQPLLLSNTGKYIWSAEPFEIEVRNDSLFLSKPYGEFVFKKAGLTLRDAYMGASREFFPPSGKMPDMLMFQQPQYNTWIELLYDQNQDDVLKYANGILGNGLPPGVIMIDDNWQEDYGNWKFHPQRFPNPKQMIDSLHQKGFKVMLWICPFISPDSEIGRKLESENLVLKSAAGGTKIVNWWNGYSTVLDLSKPQAVSWFESRLNELQNEYGIDGFKFDAGDPEFYLDGIDSTGINPNYQTELFCRLGINYPLNEYRAAWRMGGQPLAQRLRDKGHNWADLQTLIPGIVLQGLMGYPFTCPDMIGGGEMGSFLDLRKIDQELIVRSAQCHAFMPMMQFSVAPWRILDEEHFGAVKAAVALREKFIGEILKLSQEAARSGEPVIRSLEYVFPNGNYEKVADQFLIGNTIMVAPFLDTLAFRNVVIPEGKWIDDRGKVFIGPRTIKISSELNRVPYYIKKEK